LKTADLVLSKLDLARVAEEPATWEKVLKKLKANAMPPNGARRPETAARTEFVSWLAATLDQAAVAFPNPGRPAIHRLNRAEYVNVIADLLSLDIDGRALLPPDDTGYGFDNIGDVLTMSSSLLDRYLLAADKVSALAVGNAGMRPGSVSYSIPFALVQDSARLSEELPFGSRGGASIHHQFPVDGEYQINIRLMRGSTTQKLIRGIGKKHEIDLRLDGSRVRLFTLGGPEYLEYRRKEGNAKNAGFNQLPTPQDEDKVLEVRLPVRAGPHSVGVSFNQENVVQEGYGPSRTPVAQATNNMNTMSLDAITITGPFNPSVPKETPSREKIFVCHPTVERDELPCAKTILSKLARRAYRRPVNERDLRRILSFYEAGRHDAVHGEQAFEAGIRTGLQSILADIDFLVRVEHDPAKAKSGANYRLNDLELASRLSFFLWGSIPDEELLTLAESHKLTNPTVLTGQVQRMIRDERANRFLKGFFGQWLTVRNMQSSRPDANMFPEFDENLREAFQRETELFLQNQLAEDHSAVQLLTANYTFLNDRLARHYGIPNVYGSHYRRVEYPDDRRAGLLGQGSVLTVTSYANRTSPVGRGKWILENFLGLPPPPPPANVPALKEDEAGARPTSMRERMEQHRKNPVCAACHSMLDPLGFALENFDAVGKWRSYEGATPVNASGAFPTGERETFSKPAEFRRALLMHSDEFIETMVSKLLTYATGRGLEYYDMPTVRAIVRDAKAADYRWSAIITGIVRSPTFQMRRADTEAPMKAGNPTTGKEARIGQ
jgi:hypothetical protein